MRRVGIPILRKRERISEKGVVFVRSIIVKRQSVLFTRVVRKIAKPLCWNNDMTAMPRANGSRNKKRPPIKRHGILLINEIRIRMVKNVKKIHR